MIVDENTTIVLANSECLAATGYSPEKLVGTIWTKYVAPDDLEMMKRNSRLRLQDPANAPNRYDVHLVNARGEIRNTTLTIGLIPEIHQFVVSMLDITERKQAEMAVRESEEKFRMVFENVFDGISIYREDPDLSKRILVECNDQYAALAGRSREELLQLGSTFGLWTTLEDNTTNTNHLKSIASGTTYRGSFSWIRPDGKDNVIEYVGVPITWQGKTYSIGIDRDVTERKQMEEGLRNVQKLEGLGTLAGGIAHDFNNILGIILAYNSSIKKFKDDSKNLDLATETISKAVNRGKTLVQQILTFARKTETSFGAVNVNDVAMEIVTMIYEMFPKTVICSQNFDKSIPYINADRSQLHQTLLNLCINARDAMSEGGVLTMKTRMESAAHLHSRYPDADAANYVCLEVSDTGEGMTPETQKRIFEPFFTTKGIGKGTGLGLAVVFGIVQTHKGFIDVKSEQGTGTTFKIYLPVSEVAKPMTEKEEESLKEIQGGTETLLVVEDEEMLAIPLQMALVDKGYKVLTASDGFTALKIFQESKDNIALVLTDLGLPTISGLEVCHKIKQINPKEHVILATGFLDPEVKAKFLKAGIEHFLYKPYDLTKVLKEVREVLDGK
jgi:PAS domain S-box-containing protein